MAAPPIEPTERLEERLNTGGTRASKRLLIIVNPYATTVSDRLKNLVVYALRGSYEVDAIDTERRDHATDLCRQAANEGYDGVVAFGGDGTLNEAANGLIGSETPLLCLPGGRTNVMCRILGIPHDVIDATEHLLGLADSWAPQRIDVGRLNGRVFLFSAGAGLDASVVERVDAHPRLKARAGEYYYAWVATGIVNRRYLVSPPRFRATLGDESVTGITALVQNAMPYTYFGRRAVHAAEDVSLQSGDLGGVILRRATPLDIPTITFRALNRRTRLSRHRQVTPFSHLAGLTLNSVDDRPLPLQVDGDYIGEASEARFEVAPAGLRIVA